MLMKIQYLSTLIDIYLFIWYSQCWCLSGISRC